MVDRRVPEAASLRLLFQEQWDLLRQLATDWQHARRHGQAERQTLDDAVEVVVEGTDSRLRALSNYQKRLRQSTRQLLIYIEEIVSQMPAPALITKQTFAMEPAIGRLFQSLSLVERLIEEHQVTRRSRNSSLTTPGEIYALFSLFKIEKQGFGAEIRGEILVQDVLQTCISFVGHEVIALEETECAVRSALKRVLFESVVTSIRLETLRIRHARSLEEQRRDALDPTSNIRNPAVYLKTLQQLLASPRDLIVLQSHALTINAMGIKATGTAAEHSTSPDRLDLNEIAIGDSRPRVLYMTRHPRTCSL